MEPISPNRRCVRWGKHVVNHVERSPQVVAGLENGEGGQEPSQKRLNSPAPLWRNHLSVPWKSRRVPVSQGRGLSYPRVPDRPQAGCPQASTDVYPVVVDNGRDLSTTHGKLSTPVDNSYIGSAAPVTHGHVGRTMRATRESRCLVRAVGRLPRGNGLGATWYGVAADTAAPPHCGARRRAKATAFLPQQRVTRTEC